MNPTNFSLLIIPIKALEKLKETQFSVVVSDQRMLEMDGTVFLEKVREKWPDTIRIILTGFADYEAAVDAINRGSVYRFSSKPWVDEELLVTIKFNQ